MMTHIYAVTRAKTGFAARVLLALPLLGLLLLIILHQPVSAQSRIVAIGDLHGDYEAFEDIATAAGLIGGDGAWSGGETTYVQLGDIADRGPDSLRIIEHLQKLEPQAQMAGGEVVVLIGNHEAMNVIGDLRYVHPGEYEAFRTKNSRQMRQRTYDSNRAEIEAYFAINHPEIPSRKVRRAWLRANPLGKFEHRAAWGPDGTVGRWIAQKDAVVMIGDTLFVHGGLSAEIASRPIAQINEEVRESLAGGRDDAQSLLSSPLGPLWYRGNLLRADPGTDAMPGRISIADELDFVLESYGARRLVVGHTPNLEGITARSGGRLIQADSGISRYYGGVRSYLEVIGERAFAHNQVAGSGWSIVDLPIIAKAEAR